MSRDCEECALFVRLRCRVPATFLCSMNTQSKHVRCRRPVHNALTLKSLVRQSFIADSICRKKPRTGSQTLSHLTQAALSGGDIKRVQVGLDLLGGWCVCRRLSRYAVSVHQSVHVSVTVVHSDKTNKHIFNFYRGICCDAVSVRLSVSHVRGSRQNE